MRLPRRPIAALLMTWYLPACASQWRAEAITPQDAKETIYAGDARIRTADGNVYRCHGLWVSSDSLGGWLQEPAGTEIGFALADVRSVQTRATRGRASGRDGTRAAAAGISSQTTVSDIRESQKWFWPAVFVAALAGVTLWLSTWDGPFGR